MAISTDDLGRITQDTTVTSSDGDRLGTVDQVYTSDTTGDPAWVTVKTGAFGSQESFVPLSDAAIEGDDVRVGVTKDAVHGAPRVDAGGHLSVEEEDELYRYYGLSNPDHSPDEVAAAATGTERSQVRDDTTASGGPHSGPESAWGDAPRDTDATTVGPGIARGDDSGDQSTGTAARLAGAGAAGGAAAAAGADRDDELADRDAEGRDEVADRPTVGDRDSDDATAAYAPGDDSVPRRAQPDDGGAGDQDDVKPGERTTRLRRYVVTERVVQTIEELPDDDPQR